MTDAGMALRERVETGAGGRSKGLLLGLRAKIDTLVDAFLGRPQEKRSPPSGVTPPPSRSATVAGASAVA
jgi:hypothetical protein